MKFTKAIQIMDKITTFRGKYNFLSNFYYSVVEYEGMKYSTVEHAYQAAKTKDQTIRKRIQEAVTPAGAKSIGRTIKARGDWYEINLIILESLIRQKFINYPTLGRKLLDTGDAEIIEGNTWNDQFFGMTRNKTGQWVGENHLGKILMKIRQELQEKENV